MYKHILIPTDGSTLSEEPFFTILAVLVFGASVILLVWGVFRVLPPVGRLLARSFWCPFRDCNVTAEFREDPWDGARVDVSRCTAFTPPEAITCQKACLQLKTFPASTHGARSPVASAELPGGVV